MGVTGWFVFMGLRAGVAGMACLVGASSRESLVLASIGNDGTSGTTLIGIEMLASASADVWLAWIWLGYEVAVIVACFGIALASVGRTRSAREYQWMWRGALISLGPSVALIIIALALVK